MIEARHLVKRHGSIVAVNDLSFSIRPGLVTGFLGPNGAGNPVTGLRLSFLRLDPGTRSAPNSLGRCQAPTPNTTPARDVQAAGGGLGYLLGVVA